MTKHVGGAAMHLASLSSAFGIGIIVGGMALGVWGGFRRRMQTSLTGLIGLGLGFLLLGLTPDTMFTWKGNHPPRPVHAYRDGKLIESWDLDNQNQVDLRSCLIS